MFRKAIMADAAAGNEENPSRIVMRALAERLARALAIAAEVVDPAKRLDDYDVESLMALELRNWLSQDFGEIVTLSNIMDDTHGRHWGSGRRKKQA